MFLQRPKLSLRAKRMCDLKLDFGNVDIISQCAFIASWTSPMVAVVMPPRCLSERRWSYRVSQKHHQNTRCICNRCWYSNLRFLALYTLSISLGGFTLQRAHCDSFKQFCRSPTLLEKQAITRCTSYFDATGEYTPPKIMQRCCYFSRFLTIFPRRQKICRVFWHQNSSFVQYFCWVTCCKTVVESYCLEKSISN